jgi:predicted  nucleic acid-binding Zn-ribbon protein
MKSDIPAPTSGDLPSENRDVTAKVDPYCALTDALKQTSDRLAVAEAEAQSEKLRAVQRLSDFLREQARGVELQADLAREHDRAEKLEDQVARVERFCKRLEANLLSERERLHALAAEREQLKAALSAQ